MSEKQVRDYDKFMLRFPDGMRDAIAERAKRNGRSMNSEIIQIIQDALDAPFPGQKKVTLDFGGNHEIIEIDATNADSVMDGFAKLLPALQVLLANSQKPT